jgi:DNA-binding transcriptional ArsR family regulator
MATPRTRKRMMDEQSAVTVARRTGPGHAPAHLSRAGRRRSARPHARRLAATLDVPGSTLSFHLKELMHARMVSQERDGRNLIYRPSLEQMNALLVYLTAHCCQAADDATCEVDATSAAHDLLTCRSLNDLTPIILEPP